MRARLVAVTLITLAVPFGLAAAQNAASPPHRPSAAPMTPRRTQATPTGSPTSKARASRPSENAGQNAKGARAPAGRVRRSLRSSTGGSTCPARLTARPCRPSSPSTTPRVDRQPILAFIQLSDEQQRAIAEGVKAANAPVASTNAKVTEELAPSVAMQELPGALAKMPEMRDLKYVRLDGRILLVYAPNRFVVGEIKG